MIVGAIEEDILPFIHTAWLHDTAVKFKSARMVRRTNESVEPYA